MKPENKKRWADAYGAASNLTGGRKTETAFLAIAMVYQESLETVVGTFIEGYRKERDTKSKLVEHLKNTLEKGRQSKKEGS
jgi:hypothetical protein